VFNKQYYGYEGEQEYQRAHKTDLQEGNLLKVEVRGKELVLSMVDERSLLWKTNGPLEVY
jgi:hypothetical protein